VSHTRPLRGYILIHKLTNNYFIRDTQPAMLFLFAGKTGGRRADEVITL